MADQLEIPIHNVTVLRERMNYVWQQVNKAIHGGPIVVHLKRASKSLQQERKYHAMIRDIHVNAFRGNTFEGVKALCVAEFAAEMKEQGHELTHPGETVYSHKLKEWVTVRASTKKFRKAEAAAFIEYLYAFGCELGVSWSDESLGYYQELMAEAAAKAGKKANQQQKLRAAA